MIAIVDYEMGNLGSVAQALAWLGAPAVVSSEPEIIRQADAVILPGVGAMEYAMERLCSTGMDQAVKEAIESGRPFLGICLGMQLMFETSEEGDARGLGILAGKVRKFASAPGLKIPHMGWNSLDYVADTHLLQGAYYYFVHSYYCDPSDKNQIAAVSNHGQDFAASIRCDNVLLTQFHPEKSGAAGLRLLKSWIDLEVSGK